MNLSDKKIHLAKKEFIWVFLLFLQPLKIKFQNLSHLFCLFTTVRGCLLRCVQVCDMYYSQHSWQRTCLALLALEYSKNLKIVVIQVLEHQDQQETRYLCVHDKALTEVFVDDKTLEGDVKLTLKHTSSPLSLLISKRLVNT